MTDLEDLAAKYVAMKEEQLLDELDKLNDLYKSFYPNSMMIVKFGKTYIELLEPEDVENIKENL